jgi:hypothetical protein
MFPNGPRSGKERMLPPVVMAFGYPTGAANGHLQNQAGKTKGIPAKSKKLRKEAHRLLAL